MNSGYLLTRSKHHAIDFSRINVFYEADFCLNVGVCGVMPDTGYISGVGVEIGWRNLGIGKLLLAGCSLVQPKVKLDVDERNLAAINLYTKCGLFMKEERYGGIWTMEGFLDFHKIASLINFEFKVDLKSFEEHSHEPLR